MSKINLCEKPLIFSIISAFISLSLSWPRWVCLSCTGVTQITQQSLWEDWLHVNRRHVCSREYHTLSKEDAQIVICNTCKSDVMRGGCHTTPFNTTNLIMHLKNNHLGVHAQYREWAVAANSQPTCSLEVIFPQVNAAHLKIVPMVGGQCSAFSKPLCGHVTALSDGWSGGGVG